MRFVLVFKIDALGASRGRQPPEVTFGPLGRLWDVSSKTLNYKSGNSLLFQVQICLNKIENNAMNMYLYERFKIDALGTFKGRHPTDVFSGRFEDVHRTFLQNWKKK